MCGVLVGKEEGIVKLLPLSLAFGIYAGAFQGYASHSPLSFRNLLLTFRERWMGTFFHELLIVQDTPD